jgi:sodium transport system ATP-binding protein
MAPLIELRGVDKRFGSLHAVDNVSFEVAPGEVVGLLGPNGAGKTTTLRIIATLLRPDGGSVSVAGHDTRLHPVEVRSSLGYHTGDTGLYNRLTPREFLTYFATLHGVPSPEREQRVERILDAFDIAGFADRLCGTLSTGQKQRVSLGRTLVNDPPVIVLDEPTSGLDILSSQFILTHLQRLAAEGRGILFSTHILSEVELICHRVVCMHRGRVILTSTVDGLRDISGDRNLTRAFLEVVRRADAERAVEGG